MNYKSFPTAYRLSVSSSRLCSGCGQPSTGWNVLLRGEACDHCAQAAEERASYWRDTVHTVVTTRLARWLASVPDEDVNLLLFSLLDNGMQRVFGIDGRVVNMEEAVELVAVADTTQRRGWLSHALCHRLTDSLWTWRVLGPYVYKDVIEHPDSPRCEEVVGEANFTPEL